MYSLESPLGGNSNENTQHTSMLYKIKDILIMPPDLALLSTLIGSNYPSLELIFMVPNVFEPLKFDCINTKREISIISQVYITSRYILLLSCEENYFENIL